MATHYFNIQSKGGAGKSMLTYFQALKQEESKGSLFVDLDGSTRTSSRQLQFLKGKQRVVEASITDSVKRIEREKLFIVLEGLNKMGFESYYLDFGAPESEQLPNLFTMDFTVGELKEFEEMLEARFVFNIVVAGGPAYLSSMEYVQKVAGALEGRFEVWVWVNEYSFKGYDELVGEIKAYAEANTGLIAGVKVFGDIAVDRDSGADILDCVRAGRGCEGYSGFAMKIILRRELSKV